MVGEWKTLRINHISRTMKGKNERMALAATEKAKVCASVLARYCRVGQPRCSSMCFHGRSKSLVAGDSAAGTGAESTADEMELEVIRILRKS